MKKKHVDRDLTFEAKRQKKLITKTDFDAKLSRLNRKISSNKSRHLLVKNELKKLKAFDSGYYIGKSHFEEDGTQGYLVFQPMYRHFKRVIGVGTGSYIYFWKSKGFSDENITAPIQAIISLTHN